MIPISNVFTKKLIENSRVSPVVMNVVVTLLILLSITCLVLGYLLIEHSTRQHLLAYNKYPLLSKRVFIEDSNDLIVNFVPLRKALKDYVSDQDGRVGVYFEYLPSGSSIGANDTEEVKLASLSKVPLAMSILKKIEKGELSLETKITLKKEFLDSKFGDLWKKGEGAIFSVEELIEQSLKHSDNTAYEALFSLLNENEVIDVYNALEIEVKGRDDNVTVSPKSYSSIFRSLYLSTYLKREDSQYILEILSDIIFKDKIPAGVPSSVLVSHKIGVFNRIDTPDKVYTDCGIVYYPLRPYILCIFVQDTEMSATKHMQFISKMVYGYVDVVPAPSGIR